MIRDEIKKNQLEKEKKLESTELTRQIQNIENKPKQIRKYNPKSTQY
jgi:hypothetical protein